MSNRPSSLAGLRCLLYSHDSWGLGHLKRSLAIASALTTRFPDANVLVVTGSPCATQFNLPENCDVLKLPSVSKDAEGQYISRNLTDDVSRTIDLRSRLILEAYRSFKPHLVLVDHQLTGLHGEALPMLHEAHEADCILIYGMRDVLDDPEAVAVEWDRHENHWALRHGYESVCVYGTPEVFDPRTQYPMLAPHKDKVNFTGYIVSPLDYTTRLPVPTRIPHVLVTMGGGQDGRERLECFFDSLLQAPPTWTSHVLTGPLMEAGSVRHFKRLVQRMGMTQQVRVSRFHNNIPHLLQAADAVVSMAGYNSCAEILQSRIPAILLPRTTPRREQLIRAKRFQALGLAQCLTDLQPADLRDAIESALELRPHAPGRIDLEGTTRFCELVEALVTRSADGSTEPLRAVGRE